MRGRVGVLKTKHGDIKTPNLMPVIHPRKQTVNVKEYGADIVITNAYLIYKDEELSKKALDVGLHELINFDGPIMTDSGSFQLSVYGDVEIGNKEVIEFQEAIGTDIGVIDQLIDFGYSKEDAYGYVISSTLEPTFLSSLEANNLESFSLLDPLNKIFDLYIFLNLCDL